MANEEPPIKKTRSVMSRSCRKTVTFVSFGVEYLHEWSVGVGRVGGGLRVSGALLSAQTIDGSGEGQILLARMSESWRPPTLH